VREPLRDKGIKTIGGIACILCNVSRTQQLYWSLRDIKNTLCKIMSTTLPSSAQKEYLVVLIPCTVKPAAIPFNCVGATGQGGSRKSRQLLVIVMLAPVYIIKQCSSVVSGIGQVILDK
jgi:hypothetical protein